MLYKIKEKRLMLFGGVLSEIQRVNANCYNVVDRSKKVEKCNAIELKCNISFADLIYSCLDDFGFTILSYHQIREYFSDMKDVFSHLSVYYRDDYGVCVIDSDGSWTVLYDKKLSDKLTYIHEFQDTYFKMTGRETVYDPQRDGMVEKSEILL